LLSLGGLAKEPSSNGSTVELCLRCGAAVSCLSQLTASNGITTWTCEFCGQENTPNHLSLEAVPQSHCADYLLEPAAAVTGGEKEEGVAEGRSKGPDNDAGAVGKKGESEKKKAGGLVIFAVDVSGSMCTTTEVPALQAEWASAAGRGGGTKHISRLEAIKQAVDRHLEHMALTNPDNTVCT
jgi:transcription elongation factor Elf1